MENQEAYEKAKKRVEAKFGFYIHLSVYIIVNLLLVIINFSTSTQYLWFKWPLMGWGIGLFFHAFSVFLFSTGSAIKEQMIEKEIEREALRKQK
ncbi:MAG: 2TM domain-containing protein [Deltaproteobacteria bacterium]|nr:2TM domain-containing protein [Deltaproteobacteria bacterium]